MTLAELREHLRERGVVVAIADALRRFTPQERANYLAAAGYDAT
jgi:hypothetical protein